jgi:diacylglycerol kinase family enzyme
MNKIFIIVNGIASRFNEWEKILFFLKRLNLNFEFKITYSPEEAKEVINWAKNKKFENIVIGGGDGSCNLLINQIANTSFVGSFIPLGTGNLLAKELGLFDIKTACKVLLRKKIEEFDLSLVENSIYCGCIVGIGADGERAYKFSPERKQGIPISYQKYFLEAINEVVNPKEFDYRIETSEGKVYEGKSYQIFIGNIASFFLIERPNLSGLKRGKDGLLDIVILKSVLYIPGNSFAVTPKTFIKALILAIKNKESRYYSLTSQRESEHFVAKKVKIFLSPPQYYHIDGEVFNGAVKNLEIVSLPKSVLIKI